MVPDQELLRRFVATRDQAAFAELVARHVHAMYGAARRVCPADADDVTQAAFVVLAQKAHTLDDVRNLSGWLYRTTLACAANARRNAARRLEHEREASMERSRSHPRGERASDAAMLSLLDELLPRLPDEMREAVLVRHIEGRTPDEAATLLGLSIEAAAKRASRGIAMLRELFAAKGVAVPVASVATLLATQSANAAPAAVITTATAAAGIATAPAAATSTSLGGKAVTTWLSGVTATAFIVAAIFATAWFALDARRPPPPRATPPLAAHPSAPTAAAPSFPAVPTPADEARLPGKTVLAVAGVTLDGDAFDDLVRVTQATESAGVRRGTSADVFASLRRFLVRRPGVVDGGVLTHYAASRVTIDRNDWIDWPAEEIARVFDDDPVAVSLSFTHSRPQKVRITAAGSVELHLDDPGMVAVSQRHDASPRMRQSATVPVTFDGAIVPGESVLVMHEFPRLMGRRFAAAFVYQAYRAAPEQHVLIAGVRWVEPWLHAGPTGARSLADRALRWAGGNKLNPDDVPAEWTRKLANGATVKLMAVSRPARWPFCWWDAGGTPVANDWTELSVALNAEQSIAFHLDGVSELAHERNAFRIPGDATSVELWVGAGGCREQIIREGDEVKLGADGIVRFDRFVPGDEARVYLTGDAGPDVEFTVDAITTTGERIADDTDRSIELVTDETPRWKRHEPTLPLRGRQVDHFVLRWRAREVASFENWPEVPKRMPDANN